MKSLAEFFKSLKDNSEYFLNKEINIKDESIIEKIGKIYEILNSSKPTIFGFGEEFELNYEEVFKYEGYNFDTLRLYTNNIVGTIIYDGFRIDIGSRFGDNFLKYMIASSEGFLEFENFGNLDKNVGIAEWLLIYYWKIKLKSAFRLGLYKTYKEKNEELSSIRGRIDFNSLHKFKLKAKLNCYYREHSYINEINETIKRALVKVSKSEHYSKFIKDITPIKRTYFDLVSLNIALSNLKNKKILNPFYMPYQEVYRLSLQILENQFFNFSNNSKFNALLFDISLLFEHFTRKLLIHNGFILNEKNKKEFTIPDGKKYRNIYPDIIIYHPDNTVSVYDVKYKRFKDEIKREDRFQITSYAALISSKYNIRECGIIYPIESSKVEKLPIQNLNICNKKIPFKVLFYEVEKNLENQKEKDMKFINQLKTT